jgi:hypothetical protein
MSGSRRIRYIARVLSLIAFATTASADPWLAPGDEAVRSDIELLADAGIVRGPVTTWPISWPDIARDVLGASPVDLDAATGDALLRIQHRARAASSTGFDDGGVRVSGAYHPVELRGFADSPREEGEISVRGSWLGNHTALNLQGSAVADPDDQKRFRPDGSYLGVNIGNFMISAGYMERWWGPGWDGSLILSTNARPIPTLTLERNYTDPFKIRLLSWLGPWRASIAVGEAEGNDVAVADVRFLAARVNIRPRPWLELGVSRTAQWCGKGRACGWQTFKDLLIGRDNRDASLSEADEPGNQMAGYDLRMRSPWKALRLLVYTQWIGEDEAGGLPSKFLGQFGAETWFSVDAGNIRMRAEYSDTACSFTRQEPQLDCAYRNSLYPQGYTYRGRVIGHSMDNDSRMYTFGGLLTRPNGDSVGLTVRRAELNRNGGEHAISQVPLDVDNVELRYSRAIALGRVSLGIGWDDTATIGDSDSGVRGFVSWQQGF